MFYRATIPSTMGIGVRCKHIYQWFTLRVSLNVVEGASIIIIKGIMKFVAFYRNTMNCKLYLPRNIATLMIIFHNENSAKNQWGKSCWRCCFWVVAYIPRLFHRIRPLLGNSSMFGDRGFFVVNMMRLSGSVCDWGDCVLKDLFFTPRRDFHMGNGWASLFHALFCFGAGGEIFRRGVVEIKRIPIFNLRGFFLCIRNL